jgi:hypothetical protein
LVPVPAAQAVLVKVLHQLAQACQDDDLYDLAALHLEHAKRVTASYGVNDPELPRIHEVMKDLHRRQAQTQLPGEDSADLQSQLNHAADQVSWLRNACFSLLYRRPLHGGSSDSVDTRMLLRASVIAVEVLIKLRHVLDQGLGRFLKECVRSSGESQLVMQAQFPRGCSSEKRLEQHIDKWLVDTPAADQVPSTHLSDASELKDISCVHPAIFGPQLATAQPHPATLPSIYTAERLKDDYPLAWKALCATQRFGRALDDLNPVWLEQLATITNNAKHERLPIMQFRTLANTLDALHSDQNDISCVHPATFGPQLTTAQPHPATVPSSLQDAVDRVLWISKSKCVYPWSFESDIKHSFESDIKHCLETQLLPEATVPELSAWLFDSLAKKKGVLTPNGTLSEQFRRDFGRDDRKKKDQKIQKLKGSIKLRILEFCVNSRFLDEKKHTEKTEKGKLRLSKEMKQCLNPTSELIIRRLVSLYGADERHYLVSLACRALAEARCVLNALLDSHGCRYQHS